MATEDEIIRSGEPLIKHIAARYQVAGCDPEDLWQEGRIGLMKAHRRFDPKRGVKFSTYAYRSIRGEIEHYLRDKFPMIRLPAYQQEKGVKPHRTVSMTEKPEEGGEVASECIGEEEAGYAHTEVAMEVERIFSCLTDRERQVAEDYFLNEKSNAEIAKRLGCSAQYAGRLVEKARIKLGGVPPKHLTDFEKEEITKKLIEAREAKGWTRYRLAEAAGLSAMAVVNMESGVNKPTPNTLRKLCYALGLEEAA